MGSSSHVRVSAATDRQQMSDGWSFFRSPHAAPVQVRLPHDAMIGETRSADAGTGNHGGYFPGGVYRYEHDWVVPEDIDERRYSLFFEGVYGETTVSVNDRVVATSVSGYREFRVSLEELEQGASARIRIDVDASKTPNSRWYTGAGIYRPIWIESTPTTHIAPDGVRVVTRSLDRSGAHVDIAIHAAEATATTAAIVELSADGIVVASGRAGIVDGTAAIALVVSDPRPWSADDPHLYDATVRLVDGELALDEQTLRVGLRTIDIDAVHGLRVNGRTELLRGACVHHDNGVLGAATFATAEHRRARILKEAGYNAIRSSHNPLSRSFLEACDELGLYVMDELTDVWFQHKTPHDGAERFEELWQADARSMVAKNRNRPSVIMHSIGNEIAETSTDRGVDATRRLSGFLHDLDPTRPTTMAVNLLLNLMASGGKSAFERESSESKRGEKKAATSTAANLLTAKLGRVMELVSRLPAADKASRDAFAEVDIAGYNYAYGRYKGDRKRYPARVIVGSESMPGDLPQIWRRVRQVPGVIGDFMWTGWDYLGEAGIGVWSYGTEPGGLNKPYPALIAGPGAFDITGQPGAPVFLAQAVWGMLDAPAIAVRPLERSAEKVNRTPWRTSDAIPSWSWTGLSGQAEIEVYSAEDQVELILNGRSLGRKRAGAKRGFVARFRTLFEPGELVAVGYRDGRETGRSALRSAQHAQLSLRAEESASVAGDGLVYVWVEIADEHGTVDATASESVALRLDGPAELVGFGSAEPGPLGSFTDDTHSTYQGRALAAIRRTADLGAVTITATGARRGDTTLVLSAIHP